MAVRKVFVRQEGSILIGMTLAEMEKIAAPLRVKYGLTFKLELGNFTTKYGVCKWNGSNVTIAIDKSYSVHAHRKDIRDTLLHEIAHALAGPHAGHGPAWKAWCLTVGARPVRCGEKTTKALDNAWKAKKASRRKAVVGACGCAPDRHAMTRVPKVSYKCRICRVDIKWTSVN